MNALMVIGAFTMLVLLLLIFVAPKTSGSGGFALSPLSIGIAVVCGLAAIYCSLYRLPPPGPLPSPPQSQTHLLTALAFAEAVMLSGTVVGSAPVGPLPFAAATWVIELDLILLKTLRYFQATG